MPESPSSPPLRVVHVVTGGFSGATQVAVDLCADQPADRTLLVLRRRRGDVSTRVTKLRQLGLNVALVAQWPHWLTVWQLWRLLRRWRADVLLAHGFSDHLWARYAGLLAGVPHLVHVEHNVRERYGWWRRWQSLWLARHTDAIVGVSESVRQALIRLGHPAHRCVAIPNGIDLHRWATDGPPWHNRPAAIIMAARFARQKDHFTLIRAAHRLRERGTPMHVYLAGGGSQRWRWRAEALIDELRLREWVHVLGPVTDLPQRYHAARYCVLSSHYEGLPLSLVEGMAAGCCPIGSDVEGIRDVIVDGQSGRLFRAGDAEALADALQELERDPQRAAQLAETARHDALSRFHLDLMKQRYQILLSWLVRHGPIDLTAADGAPPELRPAGASTRTAD